MATDTRMTCGQFSALEPLEPRLLLDSASVTVGQGANVSLAFQDADGSRVTVKVTRGLADVEVLGDGAVNAPPAVSGKVTATGTNLHLGKITMIQADGQTLLDIGVRGGDRVATLGEISGYGLDIGSVKAASVLLEDGAGLHANSVSSLRLRGAARTSIAAADGIDALTVGMLDGVTVTADTGVNWQVKGEVTDLALTVGAVDVLSFARNVSRNVSLDNTIDVTGQARVFKIGRNLINTPVNIAHLTASPKLGGQVIGSTVTFTEVDRAVNLSKLVTDSTVTLTTIHGAVSFGQLSGASVFVGSATKVTVGPVGPSADKEDSSVSVLEAAQYVTFRGLVDTANITVSDAPRLTMQRNVSSSLLFVTGVQQFICRGDIVGDSGGLFTNVSHVSLKGGTGMELTIDSTDDLLVRGRLQASQTRGSTVTVNGPVAERAVFGGEVSDSTIVLASSPTVKFSKSVLRSTVSADSFTGTVEVRKDMTDSTIFAGAGLGNDGLFNSGDDTWGTGSIGSFVLTGRMSGSLVGAGVDPGADGIFFTADDVGVGGEISAVRMGSYLAGEPGQPGDPYGFIAADSIAAFTANRHAIQATEDSPYVDVDFNVKVTGV